MIEQLIAQWTLITQSGDLSLYLNPMVTIPSFPIVGTNPTALVSLEVFRAMGYAPPFADQTTAESAMAQLATLGGTTAIPGILAQAGSVTPITPSAPVAPIAIPPVPVPIAPPIVPEPLIDGMTDGTDFNTVPFDDLPGVDYSELAPQIPTQPTIEAQADLVATMEPMIVTPIAAPIPYPTAEDHAGTSHVRSLDALDRLVAILATIEPVADDLRSAIATMAVDSISNGPIVAANPDTRSMPSIARSSNAEGDKWYLMIGPLANLTAEQAIEQQTLLLKAAKFTRTPKLDAPDNNDVAGFGDVWYAKITYTQAERLSWMDGTKLPVHNM